MTREEAYNRIDAIIAKHEIDDEYVTITSILDYDALRVAIKALEQMDVLDKIRAEFQSKADNSYVWITYGLIWEEAIDIIDKYRREQT